MGHFGISKYFQVTPEWVHIMEINLLSVSHITNLFYKVEHLNFFSKQDRRHMEPMLKMQKLLKNLPLTEIPDSN